MKFRLKIIQEYSNDFAYDTTSKVVIEYKRYKGKKQIIRSTLNQCELNNVIFMIRRGYTHEEVKSYLNQL